MSYYINYSLIRFNPTKLRAYFTYFFYIFREVGIKFVPMFRLPKLQISLFLLF